MDGYRHARKSRISDPAESKGIGIQVQTL
jgi:hypothetical protein